MEIKVVVGRRWAWAFCLTVTLGCGDVLSVENPDIIKPSDLEGPAGLAALRAGALGEFLAAYGRVATQPALMTDEWSWSLGAPRCARQAWIRQSTEGGGCGYSDLHQARTAIEDAARRLETADASDLRVGEMNLYAGFTYVAFAETYCGGVPFSSESESGETAFGAAETTTQILNRAVNAFTAALAGSISDEHRRAAQVGLGRALLGLGDYAGAATAVNSVPSDFVQVNLHSNNSTRQRNPTFAANNTFENMTLADNTGMNGQWFRSANDPRVPWTRAEGGTDVGNDGLTPQYDQLVFTSFDSPIPLATGIEARLIEAENALHNGTVADFVTKLSDARAIDHALLGPLDYSLIDLNFSIAVQDQGSLAANVDLLFQERAFHLFGTGHRLGDLRRLVREYGRDPETVYPTGVAVDGTGSFPYGDHVSIEVENDEANNPEYDPAACDPTQA